ncbi:type III secretion system export apparatus subunit SctV [Sansalvadorimonas verongulae]|uniref:type III secretion system export apparatus subunit SctV n=1 Tax=Sansalvadorimonas verongulae TaxID=2172824 RepID=UPI0012BC50AB|nr:type III secretion system export apparatus subunit SctV [Sansalvadorimonas verongulae]MTI14162.1 EscV/YscV/HrcV family type III secretion system export apparatus protein [Sansalvadorimonas verongulae]
MSAISIKSVLTGLGKRNDLMLAVMLVFIIVLIILPMPTVLVDLLIATNMGISTILLMTAIYLKGPLEFSSFPSVLLITTLFRLALSITTTRLILLEGDAGEIVYTFGNFVVGGNLTVGVVIFLIITIVQFLVITKGSERVAEVAARFSLDGMPGKQMSIDADMRGGAIDMEEAQRRRGLVEKESQLYGSMDGAMKFVKGDAIAGLIIIFVNIAAGVSIGVFNKGLPAGEALQLYSILTIGDGLISQIPALLISITSGIIVTRVSNEEATDLGSEIGGQLLNKPKALIVGGGLLLGFAMVPGFPTLTFLSLAGIIGGGGFYILKKAGNEDVGGGSDGGIPAMQAAASGKPDKNQRLDQQEEFTQTLPLIIDVPTSLQQRLDTAELNEELLKVRKALYMDLGVPFPGIHLRFNDSLEDDHYSVMLNEVPVAHGHFREGYVFAREQSEHLDMLKIPYETGEQFIPNLDTLWVRESDKGALENAGVSFMSDSQILTNHLAFVLKKYAEDFIGIQETRFLLEKMEDSFGELIKEVQRLIPVNKIAEIFQRLVSEDISIRNLRTILQSLVIWGHKEKEVVQLTEYVRGSLKRFISYKYSNGQNILPVYLLDQDLEDTIRSGIRQTSAGAYLALDPTVTARFVEKVKTTVGKIGHLDHKPVMITAMDIRRYVRKLLEAEVYELAVLSHQELTEEITVQPLGRISLT